MRKNLMSTEQSEMIYRAPITCREILPTLANLAIYIVSFLLWMYLEGIYYNFGTKIITPLTALMWITGAFFALILPSQRYEIIKHTKWFVLGYVSILYLYRFVIIAVAGVSSDSFGAAFNQSMPAATGNAILGWLQNLLWIIAITYPIGYFIFQAKKLPQFFGTKSKQKAIREIRSIRNDQ